MSRFRYIVLRTFVLMCLALFGSGGLAQEPTSVPEAADTAESARPVELYSLVTFTVDINPALYTNPFDSNDIELLGIFVSPSGEQLVVPGFWMQPYGDVCESPCQVEDLQPVSGPLWQIRFAPREVGTWSYRLQVRDNRSSADEVQAGNFVVTPSEQRGFIHVGANKRYFEYDNGAPYFPIGHNLNWSWEAGGGLYAYERWLQSLSEVGGNYARLVIDVPWFIGLEWDAPVGDYRAAQAAAARLDRVLELAKQYGVALQLVLLWHQAIATYNGAPVLLPEDPPRPDTSADWDDNPYNAVNGGPLSGARLFMYDEQAQELFRRRLRYIVARWGYSPQVFAWEIIDQIDRTAGYDPQVADAWLRSMISYLRQLDPHRHLITAGSREFNALLTSNPLLDFTQARLFQRRPLETTVEQEIAVVDLIRRDLQLNPIPTLLTEYSLNPWFEPTRDDPPGVHVQNTLWVTALSGAAGGGMSAWGDTYIVPQGLERYYAPLAAYTAGVDWANLDLQPAQAGLLAEDASQFAPMRVDGFKRQFAGQRAAAVTRWITADGVFPTVQDVSSYLYGQTYNSQFYQPQTYRVASPRDTYVEVAVRAVSSQAGARLVVLIDEQTTVELDIAANGRNVAARLPLSAGEHTITLENSGDDWLEIDYIEIGSLVTPVRVLTLRDSKRGVALSWLQHRDYTWEKVAAGVTREPLLFRYWLDEMPPGRYVVDIWNPISGAVLGEEVLRVGEDGVLSFELLPMDSQLALRAFRQLEPPTPTPTATPTASPTSTPTETPTLTPSRTPRLILTLTPTTMTSPVPLTPVRPTPTPTIISRIGLSTPED